MRVQSIVIVVIIILGAVSPLASGYLGARDGFAIYITYPQDAYHVGSQVNVTVHVFYRGEYYDADNVSLLIDYPGNREIPLHNGSIGKYNATFIIETDDVSDYNGEVTLEAHADMTDAIGHLEASDYVDLYLDGSQIDIYLYNVGARDYVPRPGEKLDFMIMIRNEYGPTDLDEGFPEVTVREDGTYERETLNSTRLDVGTYTFSFIADENITHSLTYRVEIQYEKTIGTITYEKGVYFTVDLDVIDVWVGIVSSTAESTELEFIAVDDGGRAVPDAVFDLEWDYYNSSDGWVNFEGTWTADHQGRARVIMDTPELDDYRVDVDGVVTCAGLEQEIDRSFPGHWNYTYQPDPFDVDGNVEGLISPGEQHTITHNVTSYGEPVANEELFVYYIDEHNIYHHGIETTDSQGQFDVTIDVPADLGPTRPGWSDWIGANFQWGENRTSMGVPYYYPPSWNDGNLEDNLDENLTLESSDLHPGRTVTIKMDHPEADGENEDCVILWRIDPAENWTRWVRTIQGYANDGCEWTGDGFVGSFRLPSFVTEDMEIEVLGAIVFIEGTHNVIVRNSLTGLFPTVIPPEPPGAPKLLTAVQDIDIVSLDWQTPTDDGGSFITSYVVYRGTSRDSLEVLSTIDPTRSYVDSTIEMGSTYYYAVAAVTAGGEGVTCDPMKLETIEYRPPSAPLNLTDSFDRIQVNLEWDAPEDDGGQPVTLYTVLRGDGPDDMEEIANTGMLMYFDTSVEVGKYYYYAIQAVNVIGVGEPCEARRVRADYITKPRPPEEVSANYVDGIVIINWSVPGDDGGAPITGYVLMRGSSPLELEHLADVGLETTFNDTELMPGVTYHYTVSAVNTIGRSQPSERFTVLVPAIDPPSTPTGLTLEFIHDRIKVTWLPSEDDGGSPVTGYRILRGVGEGVLEELTVVAIGTTYFDLLVERGRTYRYSVVAINVEKESEPSGETTLKVPEADSGDESTLDWYVWAILVGAAVGVLAVAFISLRRKYQGPA